MKRIKEFLRRLYRRINQDYAFVKLESLYMEVKKTFTNGVPNEVQIVIPRVEIREKIETPFFTKTKEVIYNSVTIVNAPRPPQAGEGEKKKVLN
jgi:hypothetical protein